MKVMFKNFFKVTPTPLIGVDIQETVVCMFELEPFLPLKLRSYAIEETKEKALRAMNTQCKYVALGLSNDWVFQRKIPLKDNLRDAEILDYLALEAENYLPYPLESMYFDFQKNTNPEEDVAFELELLAIKREIVDKEITSLKKLDLSVSVVDLASLASQRGLEVLSQSLLDIPSRFDHSIFLNEAQRLALALGLAMRTFDK